MLFGLVLGFVAGSIFGMFLMCLMAGSARRDLEWDLARARELTKASANGPSLHQAPEPQDFISEPARSY